MFDFLNFLNFPSVRVRRSNASNEYFENLFVTQEVEGLTWQKSYLKAFYAQNFEEMQRIKQNENIFLDTYFIDFLIRNFTSNSDSDIISDILTPFNNQGIETVTCVKIEGNKMTVQTTRGIIEATKFSSTNLPIVKVFHGLEDQQVRAKQCHNLSIKFTLNADFDCKLATGYVSNFSQKSKYLHSWVETKIDGQDVVFDLTRNAIINKRGYYQLNHISGPVYKIPQSLFISERNIFNEITIKNKYLAKLYLANRPLALALFKEQEEKRKLEEAAQLQELES